MHILLSERSQSGKATYLYDSEGEQNMPPQICYFGIFIILNESYLGNSWCKKGTPLSSWK